MRIAIMQPYFFPYAGYFRLFTHTDLFVIYDCVQFPRRGWVHRNRVFYGGQEYWLTLPLQKCPQSTLIKDLSFRANPKAWHSELLSKSYLSQYRGSDVFREFAELSPSGSVVDYLESTLHWACTKLEIPFRIVRSSSLKIAPELRAQDRILEICRRLGAQIYVNSPGGRELYAPSSFAERNVTLEFLDDYQGSYESMLPRLLKEHPLDVACDVKAV